MGFWASPWHTDTFRPYGRRPYRPLVEQKWAFCRSESCKKMLNTTSWHVIHAVQQQLKTFYNQSIDQWPTFFFEKVTHDAICTLWGDMRTGNVVTMWHYNSRTHVKIRNLFRSFLPLFWCVFWRHHVTLTNFDLMIRDRSDRSWTENHNFVTASRHQKLKTTLLDNFFFHYGN